MKRLLILALALATMLALAAPVGAKKPPRLELGVTIEANLWWANADGDLIVYTIEVAEVPGYSWTIDTSEFTGARTPSEIGCDESSCVQTYVVDARDFSDDEGNVIENPAPVINTVEVIFTAGSETVLKSASTAVDMYPIKPCGFPSGAFDDFDHGGACIHEFDVFDYGTWTIVSKPDYSRAGRNPGLTMRDHVPGNWCMDADTVAVGPKPTPASLTMSVSLPNPFLTGRAWKEIGMCTELGGHGACTEPDCSLAVGNPHSFVLVAPPGTVSASRP